MNVECKHCKMPTMIIVQYHWRSPFKYTREFTCDSFWCDRHCCTLWILIWVFVSLPVQTCPTFIAYRLWQSPMPLLCSDELIAFWPKVNEKARKFCANHIHKLHREEPQLISNVNSWIMTESCLLTLKMHKVFSTIFHSTKAAWLMCVLFDDERVWWCDYWNSWNKSNNTPWKITAATKQSSKLRLNYWNFGTWKCACCGIWIERSS